jgi:hydroxylaminobenzene mutase
MMGNPRMALSSHLEGVMNGMFLVLIGLIWHKLKLSAKWLNITFWLALYGTFANWAAILIASIFNGGKTLTVAANGQESSAPIEGLIMAMLVSLSLAMVIICITILVGLKRNMAGSVD